ncbi:phage tail protein [Methylobacterium nodulans]|uniref:p2 GpU family protein n=1 Tax=Methylobacterium nodulans (strain LMG 21967 / CNCM I-2342 / ORS 2060) TaxID=460265 RepID=B8IDN7_METNO|nr:phage tail protein [Methylobacterium nodulans]ACL55609.1 P2 GpU family protein [Methylobacterium nodulans ORS 2060]
MQYSVGVLTFDTFPFSVTGAEREDGEDYAKHDLLNRRRGYEHEGPADDVLTLSGEFLPFHIGGMSELELARDLKNSGSPQYVMRGDGYALGWYVITSIKDSHADAIAPDGVAYKVKYEIKLERVDDPGEDAGAGLIASLVASLFG